jgi:hypothetical protein
LYQGDEFAHGAVQQRDAPNHHLDGVLGEAGLERERESREQIPVLIDGPVEEALVRVPQQPFHEQSAAADSVEIDVGAMPPRIYANANRALARDCDDDLEPRDIQHGLIEDAHNVERLVGAALESHLSGWAVGGEQSL